MKTRNPEISNNRVFQMLEKGVYHNPGRAIHQVRDYLTLKYRQLGLPRNTISMFHDKRVKAKIVWAILIIRVAHKFFIITFQGTIS